MNEEIYYIWLSECLKNSTNIAVQLLKEYKTVQAIYEVNPYDIAERGMLTPDTLKRLNNKNLDASMKILETCMMKKIQIITMNNIFYPDSLKHIYNPPLILYGLGNMYCLNDPIIIGVVGTRDPDEYCTYTTKYLTSELVKKGVTIVSGCAVGIDSVAHSAALEYCGATIGVLGCGLDVNYPPKSYDLKVSIVKRGGALISEFPPGTKALPAHFPNRNRIISGISSGVLVTQAPTRSGSLITAELALEQGKELFCLPPHNMFDDKLKGVVKFLRDGAVAVYDAEDIWASCFVSDADIYLAQKLYEGRIEKQVLKRRTNPNKTIVINRKDGTLSANDIINEKIITEDEFVTTNVHVDITPETLDSLTEKQVMIYNCLSENPITIDEIVIKTDILATEVITQLNELELLAAVKSHSGSRYSK